MGLKVRRITVGDNERILLLKDGRVKGILEPGEHFVWASGEVAEEKHDVRRVEFRSEWADFVLRAKPALADKHFTIIATRQNQAAVVTVDGRVRGVVPPSSRAVYWKGVADVSPRLFDLTKEPEVPPEFVIELARLGKNPPVEYVAVVDGQCAVVFLAGRLYKVLGPGSYAFWNLVCDVQARYVDLRLRSLEVQAQNVVTRDKVPIAVSTWAEFRVDDPVQALQSVADFQAHLRNTLLLTVLRGFSPLSLEEALAQRGDIDMMLTMQVREEMARFGVKVQRISITNLALPPEFRGWSRAA